MRKSFLLLILIFVNCFSHVTKEQVDSLQSVREVQLKKDLIFAKSLEWMSRNFVSSKNVIELQDKENGKIVGNITFPTEKGFHTARATMVITIKDNRYKLYMENLYQNGNATPHIVVEMFEANFPDAKAKFNQIDNELYAFLQGKNSKDNF